VISSLPALHKPRELADTVAYLRISGKPLLSPDFWGSTRPLVFPLLLKLAHQDLQLAAALQLGVSILAWGLLAWIVTRQLRVAGLKPFAFALVLGLSLDRHIAGWDAVMMSESLSVSLLVCFVAIGIGLLEEWKSSKLLLLLLIGLLLAFTRDTNAWLLLLVAMILIFAAVARWSPRRVLLAAAFFVAIFLLNVANANMGGRWVFPLGNLIARRILPDETAVRYFTACGMPTSPNLMRLLGGFANSEDRAMFEDPELEPFRQWLLRDGKACYARWLTVDPAASIGVTVAESEDLFAFSSVDKYLPRAFDPLMPIAVGRFLYPERFSQWIWLLCSLAAAAVVVRRSWRIQPLWAVFACLTLLLLPHLFLAWHGDAMAPERHALSVGVQLSLALWLLAVLAAEALWLRLRPPPEDPALSRLRAISH
jgi:hypothetical protein